MGEKLVTITLPASRRDGLKKSLGYIRCWIQGFEAAGKTGPHDKDALRQLQVILGDAEELPASPSKGRAKPNAERPA